MSKLQRWNSLDIFVTSCVLAGQYWQSLKAYSGSVGLSYMAAQSRDCEETDAVKALASLSVGVLSSKRYSAWIQTHTVKNPTSILYIDANSPRSLLTCAFHTSLQPPWWANGTWQRLHVGKPNQSPRRTFRSLRSPVLSYEHEGDTFSKPLSPDLLHTYAGQRRPNAEPLQTRRFEHLNHSAEASSTTCSWVTFWNLTKEQYKLISIVFSCLLTDIGPCVCAYCQGHSPVTTNLWGSDQKSEVDLSSDSSLSTSSCFCCLTFALIPTSEGNFRS